MGETGRTGDTGGTGDAEACEGGPSEVPDVDRRTPARRAGDATEAAAARYLEARGLVRLARQYVRRVGELDLVMVEPGTGRIVFVEVRCRASGERDAALSVDAAKRRRLRRVAAAWLQRHADPRRPARIDVLGMAPASGDPRGPLWEGYRVRWLRGAVDDG